MDPTHKFPGFQNQYFYPAFKRIDLYITKGMSRACICSVSSTSLLNSKFKRRHTSL